MGRVQIFNVSDVLSGAIFCKPANKTVIIHLWCVWELICVTQKLYSDFFKVLILLVQNFCVDTSINAQQKEKKRYLKLSAVKNLEKRR